MNIPQVLNMPGLLIWQGSEYKRVARGSKYATTWLNMSKQDVNMPEFTIIGHGTTLQTGITCKKIPL